VRDFVFRLIYFLIISFLIYENHKASKEIFELKETIYTQDKAIKLQNRLIEVQKKIYLNYIETNEGKYYNPLNHILKNKLI
jgi:hypothetical protein